jgi:hypothetical protein
MTNGTGTATPPGACTTTARAFDDGREGASLTNSAPKMFRYGQRSRTSRPYCVKAGVGHLALRESRFFLRIGSPREPQRTPENPSRLGNHLGNI